MDRILIVGYGTLLYKESLGKTIGDDAAHAKRMHPVRVLGYRRLFNLRPTHYESSALLSECGNENAAMNVESAAGIEVNGLAFEVSEGELERLDSREKYYRRRPAAVADFFTGEALGNGYVYSSTPDAPWIERDPKRLLPLWRDVEWARAGAYAVAPEFGTAFDRTTYLADGTTLVAEHYRDLLRKHEGSSP